MRNKQLRCGAKRYACYKYFYKMKNKHQNTLNFLPYPKNLNENSSFEYGNYSL